MTPELLWQAYEQLEKSKVRGAGAKKLLTNIISLIRFAMGQSDVLEPFPDPVNSKFNEWLEEQKKVGIEFTAEQMEWLEMIKDHITTSLSIKLDDFDNVPFNQKGGALRAYKVFGDNLNNIMRN